MDLDRAFEHALNGQAILFTGAGFSRGALNLKGEPFKTGGQLADYLGVKATSTPGLSLDDAAEEFAAKFGQDQLKDAADGGRSEMMGTPREDRPKERRCAAPTECRSRLIAALPRTLAAVTPSFRLGNQAIKNFPLVVAQISRSMTHMFVDATTGASGYFRPGGHC